MRPVSIFGASFSHPHLSHLGISVSVAWEAYSQLNLSWVRLGCYWDEIEKKEGEYEFGMLRELLRMCEKKNTNVVMTVGMKAPRWPEFYIPHWLEKRLDLQKNGIIGTDMKALAKPLSAFILKSVQTLRKYRCIRYWQVENEPLDPSGPLHLRITDELLGEEVHTVRSLDPSRPVVVNLWGNELTKRGLYSRAAQYADIIGLDIYPRVPAVTVGNWELYSGPRDTDKKIQQIISSIKKKGKQVWISELQAEPWGRAQSCTPEHILQYAKRIRRWGMDGVFFWGFEHWLGRKIKGDALYWDAAKKAIRLLSAKETK